MEIKKFNFIYKSLSRILMEVGITLLIYKVLSRATTMNN